MDKEYKKKLYEKAFELLERAMKLLKDVEEKELSNN